jgi:hypothetical protein
MQREMQSRFQQFKVLPKSEPKKQRRRERENSPKVKNIRILCKE